MDGFAALSGLARRGAPRPVRVGFLGTGLIARYIHTFLAATGFAFEEVGVHDLAAESAAGFRGYLERSGADGRVTVYDDAEDVIRASDLVVLATIALTVYARVGLKEECATVLSHLRATSKRSPAGRASVISEAGAAE